MIRLTLPLPPPALSPNGRHHWAVKARATKEARLMAEMQARRLPAYQRRAWAAAEIQTTVYLPNARKADRDNLLASCKAYFDGLTDAGVLADDRDVVHLPLQRRMCKERPRVELVIRPIDGDEA